MSRDDDGDDDGSHGEQEEAVAAAEAYILPVAPWEQGTISSLMLMTRNKMKSRYYLS
jgi:hypothetical protein